MPETSVREYKIAKGWRMAIYIFCPPLIVFSAWLLFQSFTNDEYVRTKWFFIPISIGMIAAMVAGINDTHKSRLIISDSTIKSVSILRTRELKFDEIKGFSKEDKFTYVVPTYGDKKRIRISQYLQNYTEIQEWLASNFPDLEEQTNIEESKEIPNNENYGLTEESRAEKLAKAQTMATVLNWAGGIVAVWALFFPKPYEYAVVSSILIPIIATVVVRIYGGLIRMDQRKGSAYPSVLSAIMFPSLALFVRALSDFEIYDFSKVFPLLAGSIAALACILFVMMKGIQFINKVDFLAICVVVILTALFSFGTLVEINCLYDQSSPDTFTTEVVNKRVSSGKSTSYYLELAPGQQRKKDEVKVDKVFYNETSVGEEVDVNLYKGRFGIPWLDVTHTQ